MVIALLTAALAAPHTDADALDAWLRKHHRSLADQATWRSPTQPERDSVIAGMGLLADTIERCDPATLDRASRHFADAGFTLERHDLPDSTWVTVSDTAGRGHGWSVWRCGAAVELVVQAPHAFHDLDTDDVARHAVVSGRARGAMFNTVHRYRATEAEVPADELHPADVTRQPASLYQTISLVWAHRRPTLRMVQLHGYGRRTSQADAILSTGDADRPPRSAAKALGPILGDVRAYGHDADVLGGTRNVLGRALQRPTTRFLHVELSRDRRKMLANDPDAVSALVAILAAPW